MANKFKTTTIGIGLVGLALTGLTAQSAKADEFGNNVVQFDTETAVEFEAIESHGAYKSIFGVMDLNTGAKTLLIKEEKSADSDDRDVNKASDFLGTPSNTINPPKNVFKFQANTPYTFFLESRNGSGRVVSTVYSTSSKNTKGSVQAQFDKDFSGLSNQGVKISWDDTVKKNGAGTDFNDFVVIAGGVGNSASAQPVDPGTQEVEGQLGSLGSKEFPSNIPVAGSSISPGLSINNPIGFGADNNIGFISGSYQSRTRFTNDSDGEVGFGVGLGNAIDSVGLEVAYTLNSFGRSSNFGDGGFSAKLHKRVADDTAIAVGWNQFANIGPTDAPRNSYYLVGTQILRTSPNIDDFLSRIALSVGVGGGQFLSQDSLNAAAAAGESPNGVNVFGSAAFRIAKPISAIVEWTGSDLAAGLSIAPFGDDFPLVITPAFRDIAGVNDPQGGARFVLGVGTSFKF
jgi:hypothetical protein